MMIGMLGLIVLVLFANIWYYEYQYRKPIKRDVDLIGPYFILERVRNVNRPDRRRW